MNLERIYFMVEGGRALELVHEHLRAVAAVREANSKFVLAVGGMRYRAMPDDGSLTAIEFNGPPPSGFTRPDRNGASRPKRGTRLAEEMGALPRYENISMRISAELSVPLSLIYVDAEGTETGWSLIGYPLDECGFLSLGDNGPFAMYIPDVPACVRDAETTGRVVAASVKGFAPEFAGCRRIELEEWDALVAQRNLERKRAALLEQV